MSVDMPRVLAALQQAEARTRVLIATHRELAKVSDAAAHNGLADEWEFFANHWRDILIDAGWGAK